MKKGANRVGGTGAAATSWNARSQRRMSASVATPAVRMASLAAQGGGRTAAGGCPMR